MHKLSAAFYYSKNKVNSPLDISLKGDKTMSYSLKLISPPSLTGSLTSYLQQINDIPLLTQAEEYDLAARLQENGDLGAAQKLVLSHIRYVARVAKGYMGYGLQLADLIQEGSIGLMKAVKRFRPEVGVRLVSFAVHWIKAEIHEFILKNWRIVKIATTKAQRKLFFNLRAEKKRLGWFTNEEVNAVAKDLGVQPADVRCMEERLNARDLGFDMPYERDNDKPAALLSPVEYLEDEINTNPYIALAQDNWDTYAQQNFQAAFQKLDARSQDILQKRWLSENKSTLQDLADIYKVSVERIRQLEKNSIEKLKAFIENLEK